MRLSYTDYLTRPLSFPKGIYPISFSRLLFTRSLSSRFSEICPETLAKSIKGQIPSLRVRMTKNESKNSITSYPLSLVIGVFASRLSLVLFFPKGIYRYCFAPALVIR